MKKICKNALNIIRCLILLFNINVLADSEKLPSDNYFNKAIKLQDAAEYEKSIIFFDLTIKLNPTDTNLSIS